MFDDVKSAINFNAKKSDCKFCYPNKDEFCLVEENDYASLIVSDKAEKWGHCLVIPKNHSSNLASEGMTETIWKLGIVPLLNWFIEKFTKKPDTIGFVIHSNSGKETEQTVFHTRINIFTFNLDDKSSDNLASMSSRESYRMRKKSGQNIEEGFGKSDKELEGPWENCYPDMKNYFEKLVEEKILTQRKNNYNQNVIEHFTIYSSFFKTEKEENGNFVIKIEKSSPNDFFWVSEKEKLTYLNKEERQEIAVRIKEEQWEEKLVTEIFKYSLFGNSINIDDGSKFYLFFSINDKNRYLEINEKHPCFLNTSIPLRPPFIYENYYHKVKISVKESEVSKNLFQKEDFIKLEDIRDEKDPFLRTLPSPNTSKLSAGEKDSTYINSPPDPVSPVSAKSKFPPAAWLIISAFILSSLMLGFFLFNKKIKRIRKKTIIRKIN